MFTHVNTYNTCLLPVLGIGNILVQIRIPGSVPLTNGSGSDSFLHWFYGCKKIIFFLHIFFLTTCLQAHHIFSLGSGRPKTFGSCGSGSKFPTLFTNVHCLTKHKNQTYFTIFWGVLSSIFIFFWVFGAIKHFETIY